MSCMSPIPLGTPAKPSLKASRTRGQSVVEAEAPLSLGCRVVHQPPLDHRRSKIKTPTRTELGPSLA